MQYTTKELAQHCLNYTVPVCNTHFVNRTELLTHLAALIKAELNLIEANDPNRNK